MSVAQITAGTRRLFAALLLSIIVLSCAGCGGGAAEPSPTPSPESTGLPVEYSPPDTMSVDEILSIVNGLLMQDADGEKIFVKDEAETFTVPDFDGVEQRLYLFIIEDLETAVFAGTETDCVVSAYVRMLFDDPTVEQYMISYAGAFLAALEPNRYEDMLLEVLSGEETDTGDTLKTASGEAWSVHYGSDIMKILPNDFAS